MTAGIEFRIGPKTPFAFQDSIESALGKPTDLADSHQPNYVKEWLNFVEHSACDVTAFTLRTGLRYLPLIETYACTRVSPKGTYHVEYETTAVSIDALVGVLFTAPVTMSVRIQSPFAPSRMEDLNVAYLAETTLVVGDRVGGDLDRPAWMRHPAETIAAVDLRREPKSRAVARTLANFLNIRLEDLGVMTGIGRTTFSSWHTKTPRPATLRDLYRLDGLMTALRNSLGDERARAWLNAGVPAPFQLLKERNLGEVERLASSLLFKQHIEPRSSAIAPLEDEDLPQPLAASKSLRAAKRVVRGSLSREHR